MAIDAVALARSWGAPPGRSPAEARRDAATRKARAMAMQWLAFNMGIPKMPKLQPNFQNCPKDTFEFLEVQQKNRMEIAAK